MEIPFLSTRILLAPAGSDAILANCFKRTAATSGHSGFALMSGKFRLFLPVVLAVLLAVSSAQNVSAMRIDQSQEISNMFFGIPFSSPIGQEFKPSVPFLEAVEVRLKLLGQADTITLYVREGTIGGTILATAALSLPSGFDGWALFPLGSVKVTPEATYVIQLTAGVIYSYWGRATGNPYPRGRAIHNGLFHDDEDQAFRTYGPRSSVGGVVLPTNSLTVLAPYLAMIGLVAVAATVYVTKRRCSLS